MVCIGRMSDGGTFVGVFSNFQETGRCDGSSTDVVGIAVALVKLS